MFAQRLIAMWDAMIHLNPPPLISATNLGQTNHNEITLPYYYMHREQDFLKFFILA